MNIFSAKYYGQVGRSGSLFRLEFSRLSDRKSNRIAIILTEVCRDITQLLHSIEWTYLNYGRTTSVQFLFNFVFSIIENSLQSSNRLTTIGATHADTQTDGRDL
jgi:hypothetical protein